LPVLVNVITIVNIVVVSLVERTRWLGILTSWWALNCSVLLYSSVRRCARFRLLSLLLYETYKDALHAVILQLRSKSLLRKIFGHTFVVHIVHIWAKKTRILALF